MAEFDESLLRIGANAGWRRAEATGLITFPFWPPFHSEVLHQVGLSEDVHPGVREGTPFSSLRDLLLEWDEPLAARFIVLLAEHVMIASLARYRDGAPVLTRDEIDTYIRATFDFWNAFTRP